MSEDDEMIYDEMGIVLGGEEEATSRGCRARKASPPIMNASRCFASTSTQPS